MSLCCYFGLQLQLLKPENLSHRQRSFLCVCLRTVDFSFTYKVILIWKKKMQPILMTNQLQSREPQKKVESKHKFTTEGENWTLSTFSPVQAVYQVILCFVIMFAPMQMHTSFPFFPHYSDLYLYLQNRSSERFKICVCLKCLLKDHTFKKLHVYMTYSGLLNL